MPRRRGPQTSSANASPLAAPTRVPIDADRSGRVLVVEADTATVRTFTGHIARSGLTCDYVSGVQDAISRIQSEHYDVVVTSVTLPDGPGLALKAPAQARDRCTRLVLLSPRADYAQAIDAIRHGVADVLTLPLAQQEVTTRLLAIVQQANEERRRERHIERLKQLCRRLNVARQDMSTQMDSLCQDLVHAYQDLADQIAHVSVVTEFATVIRQELDVEELLRTTLECFLRKFGPMNAAVFLPGIDDDEFSLGAYVNYSCPRQSADLLLEHLADVITPPMLEESQVLEFTQPDEFNTHFGEGAEWMADNHILVFSCRHDDECLAVFTLFRDRQSPFPPEMAALMGSMVEIFGRQMALVIRVHHRHLPEEEWPSPRHRHDADDRDSSSTRSHRGRPSSRRPQKSPDDDAAPHFEDSAEFDLDSDDARKTRDLIRSLGDETGDSDQPGADNNLLDADDVDLPASYPFPVEEDPGGGPTSAPDTRADRDGAAGGDNRRKQRPSKRKDTDDDDNGTDPRSGLAA